MKDPEILIDIEGLELRREQRILRGVQWQVRRGEHWAILGPNGSGKTSLLSALTAYQSPSKGSIRLLGEKYGESDWRELRKKIGLVSSSIRQMIREEETTLKAVISGQDAIVNYWGKITPAMLRKGRKILREIECETLGEHSWAWLSQGEQQRVLIGRALMADPRVLFLDEPCAGLDMVARERFLGFLRKIGARRGSPALVLVTHHVEEIAPIFSHCLLLKEGKVLASGKIQDVLSSKNLSEAYGTKIRLKKRSGIYQAKVVKRGAFIL